jgi:hypothetical protein
MIFKEEVKEYVNRLRGLKDNMATVYASSVGAMQ